jgi:DNA-binding NtrC family response regulator
VLKTVATARVLIVDDEPSVLDVSSRILAKSGYSVLSASNAQEALEIFKTADIDLIISDVLMPVMQGPELLQIVRQASPDTALMLMSAAPLAPVRGIPFLRKPFGVKQLVVAVERALAEMMQARADLARSLEHGRLLRAESQQLRWETREVVRASRETRESAILETRDGSPPGMTPFSS